MATEQTTRSCEHCGAPLEPIIVRFLDREYQPGWKDCGCAGARTEREREERETAERESHAKASGRIAQAGIPPRYADATHPKARELAEEALGGQSLYVFGANGTGKTHLAMAVAREALAMGYPVKAVVVPTLLESMRNRHVEDRALTASLRSCRLLVLDDLGKEAPTAYACERLFDIINARYNDSRNLPVVVTSNYDLDSVAKRLAEGETGRSIASRLDGICRVVHKGGEDRRLRG